MFRHGSEAVAEAEEIEQHLHPGANDDLIPLSVLRLDLDPGEPWPLFLGRRGIAFVPDRIGRDAVTAGDAQRLIAERRAHDLRVQAVLRAREAELVEADELRRARIFRGVPVDAIPAGMTPPEAMMAGDPDLQPRRQSAVAAFLDGADEMVFHPIYEPAEAS
jgi:hypothetical protein